MFCPKRAAEELIRCRLLAGLDERDLDLVRLLGHRETYARGSPLVLPGDSQRRIFAIVAGTVHVFHLSQAGRATTVALLSQGDVCGLEALSTVIEPTSGVESISQCVAYGFAPLSFRAFLLAHPGVYLGAIELLAEHLGQLEDRLVERSQCGVEARVAHELARHALHSADSIVRTPHVQLGRGADATREEVTRTLGHLRDLGLTESTPYSREIHVFDARLLLSWREG